MSNNIDLENPLPEFEKLPSTQVLPFDVPKLSAIIVQFGEKLCEKTLFPYQRVFAEAIVKSVLLNDGKDLVGIFSRQCIKEGTVIQEESGRLIRIENHPRAFKTSDSDEVFHFNVQGGREIRCTGKHRVFTDRGWVEAQDLRVGDKICCLKEWAVFSERTGVVPYSFKRKLGKSAVQVYTGNYAINNELAELLGWLITDRYIKDGKSVRFTNVNPYYLNRVEYLVNSQFPDITCKRYEKGKVFDIVFSYKNSTETTLKDFLRAMDIDHGFPRGVNYFTKEQIIHFLKSYVANNGYFNTKVSPLDIELFCGKERIFAEYCHQLLLQLGISSKIKEIVTKDRGEVFSKVLLIIEYQQISKFISLVGGILDKPYPNLEFLKSLETTKTEIGDRGEVWEYRDLLSIKSLGNFPVWDVEYPDFHYFITGGVKVHNSGKTEVIHLVICSLLILMPVLAKYFIQLERFKRGIMIGAFSPIKDQVDTLTYRIKASFKNTSAIEILADQDIQDDTAPGQGDLTLKSGSFFAARGASPNTKLESKTYHIIFLDEAQSLEESKIRLSIRPMGAYTNATFVYTGTCYPVKSEFYRICTKLKSKKSPNYFEFDYKNCSKYNPNYKKYCESEKENYGEDDDFFRMMFKLEWLFSRTLFITEELLEDCLDKSMMPVPRILSPLDTNRYVICAGVDWAKLMDSTVVTVGIIDKYSKNPQGEMKKRVYNWFTVRGDSYPIQCYQIVDFLRDYPGISTLVCDCTGVGESATDTLEIELERAEIHVDIIRINFTSSKHDVYFNFHQQLTRGMLAIPGHAKFRTTKRFKAFFSQVTNLIKGYTSKGKLDIHAPLEGGAHDDYPDSLALFCWAEKGFLPEIEDGGESPFSKVTRFRSTNKLGGRY